MTVRAVDHVQLYGISSRDFLPAVTGIREAHSAADAATSAYLIHAPGTPVEDSDSK
jgi:hypothetical protein